MRSPLLRLQTPRAAELPGAPEAGGLLGSPFPEAHFPVSSFLIDTVSPSGSSQGISGWRGRSWGNPRGARGSVCRALGGSPSSHWPVLSLTPKIRVVWAPAGNLKGRQRSRLSPRARPALASGISALAPSLGVAAELMNGALRWPQPSLASPPSDLSGAWAPMGLAFSQRRWGLTPWPPAIWILPFSATIYQLLRDAGQVTDPRWSSVSLFVKWALYRQPHGGCCESDGESIPAQELLSFCPGSLCSVGGLIQQERTAILYGWPCLRNQTENRM